MALDKIFNDTNVDGIADNIFSAVNNSVSEVKQMQQRKAAENAQLVIQSLKKIDTDIREKFDNVANVIEKRVLTIKDGRDGISGSDGRNGKDGRPGRDGLAGKKGNDGLPGQNGINGLDGISVNDAHIDFDGSLIITLSDGKVLNVGEVVSPDLEKQFIAIKQGGSSGGISNVPKVVVIADATSITVNTDTTDIATQANTQVVGTLTINAPTGTAVDGLKFILRLTSANVQTFSFNAIFAGSTDLTLPTVSSGSSKTDYLGWVYNSTAAKWQLVAKVFGF